MPKAKSKEEAQMRKAHAKWLERYSPPSPYVHIDPVVLAWFKDGSKQTLEWAIKWQRKYDKRKN